MDMEMYESIYVNKSNINKNDYEMILKALDGIRLTMNYNHNIEEADSEEVCSTREEYNEIKKVIEKVKNKIGSYK